MVGLIAPLYSICFRKTICRVGSRDFLHQAVREAFSTSTSQDGLYESCI